MPYHTIQLEQTDYEYLEQAARDAGTSVQALLKQLIARQQHADTQQAPASQPSSRQPKSRWARLSERIRQNPPLHGVGEYVRECSQELMDAEKSL